MLFNIALGFWQSYPTVGKNYISEHPQSLPAPNPFELPAIKSYLHCLVIKQYSLFLKLNTVIFIYSYLTWAHFTTLEYFKALFLFPFSFLTLCYWKVLYFVLVPCLVAFLMVRSKFSTSSKRMCKVNILSSQNTRSSFIINYLR